MLHRCSWQRGKNNSTTEHQLLVLHQLSRRLVHWLLFPSRCWSCSIFPFHVIVHLPPPLSTTSAFVAKAPFGHEKNTSSLMLQVSNGIKTHGLTSIGRYSHAIVCRVPSSFATSSLGSTEPINLYEARREHETYVRILRNLGVDVIELPADETLPDSPFVEDTAVVVNGIALICKPGHPSRTKEVDTVRSVLKRELRLPIVEITNAKACIDGGDVLFTGREFFVGISNRTNEAGAQALADSFPEFTVTPIDLPKKLLHLKSCISMAGPDIICVASSLEAQLVLKRIERDSTYKYYTITVPDECGSNVAYINGALMYRSEYPGTNEVFQSKIDFPKVPIKLWELSKPSGNLTGLCLLIEKARNFRR